MFLNEGVYDLGEKNPSLCGPGLDKNIVEVR